MQAGGDETENKIIEKRTKIGSGATCVVYEGTARIAGKEKNVALKSFSSHLSGKSLSNEIKLLRNLDNINVVSLFGYSTEDNTLILELCYSDCEGQRLYDVRQWSAKFKQRSLLGDLKVLEQMASGLNYLHGMEIIHADVKPDNFLISGNIEDPIIKIADFGLAYSDITLSTVTHHSSSDFGLGTVLYQGPECCDENNS